MGPPVRRARANFAMAGDVLLLGIDGFGCGQAHSGSRPCNNSSRALLQHMFFGGWKPAEYWEWFWDDDGVSGRRRRNVPGELIDWRLPAIALHAHLNASGIDMPWEAIPLLFSRIVPIEPPLLPAP